MKINKEPWYSTLERSSFTPPGWIFGIVWPLLYMSMAVAVWIAYTNNSKNKDRIVKLYFIQLMLNAMWTPTVFGLHSIFGGIIVLSLLIPSIALLMREYYRTTMTSFYLMIPYFTWCCFALFLNFNLYFLN